MNNRLACLGARLYFVLCMQSSIPGRWINSNILRHLVLRVLVSIPKSVALLSATTEIWKSGRCDAMRTQTQSPQSQASMKLRSNLETALWATCECFAGKKTGLSLSQRKASPRINRDFLFRVWRRAWCREPVVIGKPRYHFSRYSIRVNGHDIHGKGPFQQHLE